MQPAMNVAQFVTLCGLTALIGDSAGKLRMFWDSSAACLISV